MNNSFAVTIVAAVNNAEILQNNLALSHLISSQKTDLLCKRGFDSAAAALNEGIDEALTDVIVLSHQDVYLPKLWFEQLSHAIAQIEKHDPDWAVLGVFGVSDRNDLVGHCWSTGLGKVLGSTFDAPCPAVSIDELVIIVRKSSGIRFDEKLPGFHLYGTDIVQTALSASFSAYVIHAPVVHNSKPVKSLFGAYFAAYKYMQSKWANHLPIKTPITTITRFGMPLKILQLRMLKKGFFKADSKLAEQYPDKGRVIAERVGFD